MAAARQAGSSTQQFRNRAAVRADGCCAFATGGPPLLRAADAHPTRPLPSPDVGTRRGWEGGGHERDRRSSRPAPRRRPARPRPPTAALAAAGYDIHHPGSIRSPSPPPSVRARGRCRCCSSGRTPPWTRTAGPAWQRTLSLRSCARWWPRCSPDAFPLDCRSCRTSTGCGCEAVAGRIATETSVGRATFPADAGSRSCFGRSVRAGGAQAGPARGRPGIFPDLSGWLAAPVRRDADEFVCAENDPFCSAGERNCPR
mgnify:CR=1 FL=1